MCITYDNQFLFTGSEDGSLAFIQVVDRDGRKKDQIAQVQYTVETMYSKEEREKIIKSITLMKNERDMIAQNKHADLTAKQKVKEEQIQSLKEEIKVLDIAN